MQDYPKANRKYNNLGIYPEIRTRWLSPDPNYNTVVESVRKEVTSSGIGMGLAVGVAGIVLTQEIILSAIAALTIGGLPIYIHEKKLHQSKAVHEHCIKEAQIDFLIFSKKHDV